MRRICTCSAILCLSLLFAALSVAASDFDDTNWEVAYEENFDTPLTGVDQQTFGTDGWLKWELRNGGSIVLENGYAQLSAMEFWHAALIRSTNVLPDEYRIRTKIGYINYDLSEYEQADFDHPDFNTHDGHYENGMYFLTVTNDTCVGDECAELWWHYHRKMVIDVDNHINWNAQLDTTHHPVYMVYMDENTNSGGNLLRTWNGSVWDSSAWNWNTAYTYEDDTWYYAELTKRDGMLTLALYDADSNLLVGPPPIGLEHVFDMDNPVEFLYVGEPHTDDYEGNVRIDEITLLVPSDSPCCVGVAGDVNADGDITLTDLTVLVNRLFVTFAPVPCRAAANVNGDVGCEVTLTDLTVLVNRLFVTFAPTAPCMAACE